MFKPGNITFVIIVSLVMLCPIGYQAAGKLLPFVEVPEQSALESRTLTTFQDVADSSFFDSSFQDAFESYVADSVPMRDRVLVGSALMQRVGIKASALMANYDIYHTYYSSEQVADSAHQLILPEPARISSSAGMQRKLDAFINTINQAHRNHPEINFVVDQVVEVDESEVNPVYWLHGERAGFLNEDFVRENIIERFDEGITAFCDSVQNFDEVENQWYAGDMHWSLQRASKSYNKIAETLDLRPFDYDSDQEIQIIQEWYGAYNRFARDFDYGSPLVDMPTDYSNLTFYKLNGKAEKGKEFNLGKRDRILAGELPKESIAPLKGYSQYYGASSALIENNGQNNGKTCLVVGDSFTHCLKRIIANNYEKTIVLLPGNNGSKCSLSLEEVIDKYNPDDVIVLTVSEKYSLIANKSPAFVGLD